MFRFILWSAGLWCLGPILGRIGGRPVNAETINDHLSLSSILRCFCCCHAVSKKTARGAPHNQPVDRNCVWRTSRCGNNLWSYGAPVTLARFLLKPVRSNDCSNTHKSTYGPMCGPCCLSRTRVQAVQWSVITMRCPCYNINDNLLLSATDNRGSGSGAVAHVDEWRPCQGSVRSTAMVMCARGQLHYC